MNQNNRFVPMIDLHPDAMIFGSNYAVDAAMLMHKSFAQDLDRIVLDGLLRGVEHGLRRLLTDSPKRGAEIMDMRSVTAHDAPHRCEYQLRFAVMHPAKLRELEQAGRKQAVQAKINERLVAANVELRERLKEAEKKAAKYDQLMADIAAATKAA